MAAPAVYQSLRDPERSAERAIANDIYVAIERQLGKEYDLQRLYWENLLLAQIAVYVEYARQIANGDDFNTHHDIRPETPYDLDKAGLQLAAKLENYTRALTQCKTWAESTGLDFHNILRAMNEDNAFHHVFFASHMVEAEIRERQSSSNTAVDQLQSQRIPSSLLLQTLVYAGWGRVTRAIYDSRRDADGVKISWKQHKENLRRFWRRVGMSLFGALSLLAPMLIMVLHPGLLTTLATTSVFVLVVGIVLAAALNEAEPKDVVGATAAYAAVLVVFVGTGGGSTGNDAGNESSMARGKVGWIIVIIIVGTCLLIVGTFFLWASLAIFFDKVPMPIPGVGEHIPRYERRPRKKPEAAERNGEQPQDLDPREQAQQDHLSQDFPGDPPKQDPPEQEPPKQDPQPSTDDAAKGSRPGSISGIV